MSNSKYAVMLGYEPYDYVERSAEGLLRCMRSIRRDFCSKSYYPEKLVFSVYVTEADGETPRRNVKYRTFTFRRYDDGRFFHNCDCCATSNIDEDIACACINANAEVIK